MDKKLFKEITMNFLTPSLIPETKAKYEKQLDEFLALTDNEPRVHAKWEHKQTVPFYHITGQCSNCKERYRINNYCPNCGAKMDLD